MIDNKIQIFALGGLDEIGKDLYCIDIDGDIFIIECGIKIPDKTLPGIDFIMPQFDYLIKNKNRIKAYIITHGHDVELGALPFIYKECPAPVYCTEVTRVYLEGFKKISSNKDVKINYQIVGPTDERMIAGRKVRFFSTSHNMAQSFGVAISTSKGNIVYIDDFVIDHNRDMGFVYDEKALVKIAEENTLLLMCESNYAAKPGYTAPKYKAVPQLVRTLKEAKGRLIIAIPETDIYNYVAMCKIMIKFGRKLFVYDDDTNDFYNSLSSAIPEFKIPDKYRGHRDDLNRYKAEDIVIFMTGFDTRLFKKLELFANKENPDKRVRIAQTDTVVVISPFSFETETVETDAINELYRAVNTVKYFKKNEFLKMHASEDDIRSVISLLLPKYYLPIRGSFQNLLSNAKLALDTGLGLSHQNVFVLDNGMVLEFTNQGAQILREEIPHGDLLIDGKVYGHHDSKALQEREKLSDDGVLVLGALLSREQKKIVAGPDIEMKGFIFIKDSESILREVRRIFTTLLTTSFNENIPQIELYRLVEEATRRQIRKETGKNPMVICHIDYID